MEEKITLETADNFLLYGILNSKQKSDNLIIFVHGITGHQNEHQYFNAVPYFTEKGFDVFRFNLYGGGPKSREMINVSLSIHGEDITTVLKHFKPLYKNIFLVGHSLGGPSIMFSDYSDAQSLVFWDPAFEFQEWEHKEMAFQPQLDKYIFFWGRDYLVSKEILREWQVFDLNLLEKITKPVRVIRAEKNNMPDNWVSYIEKTQNCKITTIPNADHSFCVEGTEQELFLQTYEWIEQFV